MALNIELTDEQKQIIEHPDGRHALVLAVAGSGKTTTMAYRVRHLAENLGVQAHEIRVLMFNRNAREQFQEKLKEIGLDDSYGRQVRTFHSAALEVLNWLKFPPHTKWYGESEELKHLNLKRAVDSVLKARNLEDDAISVDEAERAIALWKAALITPSRAGYSGSLGDAFVETYKRFEDERIKAKALTFDDFVYVALWQLEYDSNRRDQESDPSGHHQFTAGLRYVIVDEYQDVNFGQQRFVEMLASGGADVMVVGDDDQTIYEWRGARSDYIRREFQNAFTNKPHSSYKLRNSFRFGFLISQSSYNVISHNTDRQPKDVLAYNPADDSEVRVLTDDEGAGESPNRALADEIEILVKEKNVAPSDIWVLGRTFSQMNGLQSEMIMRRLPFKVEGSQTFLTSPEASALLNYLRVAATFNRSLPRGMKNAVLAIANKPSRYLARRDMQRMLDGGITNGLALAEMLPTALESPTMFAGGSAKERLTEFAEFLQALSERLQGDRDASDDESAGALLKWVDETVGFQDHYRDYYGEGEDSANRINNITALIGYAYSTDLGWRDFLAHVEGFDSTLGLPDKQVIHMTSVHRVKGLEFDYVFIPDCFEGFMPVFGKNDDPTFDKTEGARRPPQPADWIENERRLFYVGATRARKALYIGAKKFRTRPVQPEQTDSSERQSSEVSTTLASRFLEEMELEPTRQVAREVVKAAKGERNNRLLEVAGELASKGYSGIIGGLKGIAGRFPGGLGRRIDGINESPAERPFHYVQAYDSPQRRQVTPEEPTEIWPHIDLNRQRRPRPEGASGLSKQPQQPAPRRTVLPPKRTI